MPRIVDLSESVLETVRIDRSALKASESAASGPRAGSVSTWAMLIKRVYQVDPLACLSCGGRMKIISFIERRQADVIERMLRHCGLWEGPVRTLASARAPPNASQPTASAPHDLESVPDDEFLETSDPDAVDQPPFRALPESAAFSVSAWTLECVEGNAP